MNLIVQKRHKKSSGITDLSNNDRKLSIRNKDLICTVCGGAATGFNFSVITCMCCKAFFRRNALYGLHALQCRYLTENCLITMKSRRDCSYCRLKKCFQVGMKKELILTEDLKRVKREKILANREMTLNSIRPIDSLMIKNKFQLNDIDSTYLRNISNAYEEYCRVPLIIFEKNEYDILYQQPIKSRIKIQHYYEYYEKSASFLLNFFRRLPEFKQLSDDQELVLCKNNICFVMRISLIETLSDQLPLWPAINLLIETIFGKSLIEQTGILLHKFKEQINDSICIRLVLIILIFSTYPKYNSYTDTLHIYKIQEKYIELLWLYLKQRYSEFQACEKLSIIIRHCLQMQTIGHLADLRKQEITKQNFFLSLK
jgi:hypothetical protein